MCGKVVNEDNSLGFTAYNRRGKKGGVIYIFIYIVLMMALQFFELCCCANDDTIIGHLKAHV